MDWRGEEVLDFVALYEKEPAIWDPGSQDYKNRTRVNEAWERIAEGMGDRFSVRELKAKKLSLMATYRKLATKVRTSTDEPYKPDWFAYEAMDRFMNGVYEPRIGGTFKHERFEQIKLEPNMEDEDVSVEEVDVDIDIESEEDMPQDPNPSNFVEVSVGEPPARKRRAANQLPRRQDSSHSLPTVLQQPEKDDCALFVDFIVHKLRSLNPDLREVAMLEIHNTLFQVVRSNPSSLQTPAKLTAVFPSSSRE